jgi:hypothetical protein
MFGWLFTSKADVPVTNGALNEVPHPAEYVPKGYVEMIPSPGAATQTIASP